MIPSTVLPNMYQLADTAYVAPANHKFFVDGTPVAGDIYIDGLGHWHTILVGGLNAGGKGYYAMDVTDPSAARPTALWEFKQDTSQCPAPSAGPYSTTSPYTGDCHLGLTFGKPVITKLANRWVVMFTSGYNNDDGVGYLYVVDAYTGSLIQKIATSAGLSGSETGLAQINNYVNDVLVDNTTVRAYGGDLLGRIWRFDFGGAGSAQLIGTAKDSEQGTADHHASGARRAGRQAHGLRRHRPAARCERRGARIQHQESVYGIVDPLTTSGSAIYPALRSALNQRRMTQIGTGAGAVRTVACDSTCTSTAGWVVDFPVPPSCRPKAASGSTST